MITKNKHFVLVSVKLRRFPTSNDNSSAVSALRLIHTLEEYFWKCWLLLLLKKKKITANFQFAESFNT